jgi:hypothetical protein
MKIRSRHQDLKSIHVGTLPNDAAGLSAPEQAEQERSEA